MRGTRGLVTTLEESTGSVGESSAPSRNDSAHDSEVSACAASATRTPVIGIAEHELAQRQPPRALQHLALDLEPVAEQDHDQGDRPRGPVYERTAGVEVRCTFSPPSPSTKPATTNSAASERNDRCATPDSSAPRTSSTANTRTVVLKSSTGIESQTRKRGPNRVRITVLGKSPSWQDIDGACSGYLIEDGDTALLLDCGNGVFSKLRRFIDYVDVDAVVLSHLHADHFLDLVPFSYALTYAPRQQPVPVHRWNGTDDPAHPVLHAPTGARDTFRRICGAWGPEDLIEGAFDLREYDVSQTIAVGGMRLRSPRSPITRARTRSRCRPTARAGSCSARHPAHRRSCRVREGHRPVMVEATLPRPERQGPRGHLTPGGRRARPPGRGAAARHHPFLRRAGPGVGARRGRARVRRTGRGRARGRDLRHLSKFRNFTLPVPVRVATTTTSGGRSKSARGE